jgi:urease accessory protein
MRTLDKRIAPNVKLAASLVARAPTLTLAYDARCKSRLAATLDTGEDVAVLLPRGTVLRDGDVLVADDGALVRIVAAPETVLLVRARSAHADARRLSPRQPPHAGRDRRRLPEARADPVLADMLRRLGTQVDETQAPFQPEAGAYGGGHKHGHDATFAEDYALAQQVFGEHHGHAHPHPHDHDHRHGPGCAHGHHGHDHH